VGLGPSVCCRTAPLAVAAQPTGNLDTQSAEAVFSLLRSVNAEYGTTMLFVTHNAARAQCCHRTIEVVDGQVTGAHGAPP
jgi:lipoprotein-releasing system ATP-binding protein